MNSGSRDIDEYFQRMISQSRDQREAMEIMREYQRAKDSYQYGYPMMPAPIFSPSIFATLSDSPISKPKKPLPEEHIVAAVTGFRAWNVPLFVDELRSVARPAKWKPYERFDASCESAQCSGVSCQCGIYAFNKMELVQKQYTQEDRSKRYVYGECWLWGRVLECKDGFRAQFGYPKAFIDNGAIAKRMAEVFGVTLIPTSK